MFFVFLDGLRFAYSNATLSLAMTIMTSFRVYIRHREVLKEPWRSSKNFKAKT